MVKTIRAGVLIGVCFLVGNEEEDRRVGFEPYLG